MSFNSLKIGLAVTALGIAVAAPAKADQLADIMARKELR